MPNYHRELKDIRTFPSLIKFLRDELDWPISSEDFEELTFDYTADELGIDSANAAKIQGIKRLRPLSAKQPWGIFFVKFEPKRLPVVALRRILSRVVVKKRASAHSAERAAWQADDLLFVSNYGEGEERRITFAHFAQDGQKSELPTLKVLGWDNLDTDLHIDHVADELRTKLKWPAEEHDVEGWRETWRSAFSLRHREVITTSKALAIRLAELARAIRNRINTVLTIETDDGSLTKLMSAFKEALIHDLDEDGFADMYAQTIAYGLLSARVANPSGDTADDLAAQMPVTNPFLKELMETFLSVGGRKGKAGKGTGIDFDELGVSEVVELLDDANMEAVVLDFGDRNRQEDPVIHFYELFLKEYDAKKRMQRGIFYTPRPVVSFIVRSVDELLRNKFDLEGGLADTSTWGEMAKRHKDLKIPEGTSPDKAFVQILDPATGTGTFLVEVIDLIHKTMVAKWNAQGHGEKKIQALWNEYVPKHLLPRLHGYELLMAPYAIAHLKIGLKLYETGYRFCSDERARVYLTNTLEPASDKQLTLDFLPVLAHEAQAVNEIKRKQRFTVVIANPPYSNFGQLNRTPFILGLLKDYKRGLKERKLNLDDDFIKFVRFFQWVITNAGGGVAGFISNNTYLDGITHRQMRRSLSECFSAIDVLDLHGSVVKGERGPDQGQDENVFDIQQGVAIGLFIRVSGALQSQVRHFEVSGARQRKYSFLTSRHAGTTPWEQIEYRGPEYFFVPKNFAGMTEYQQYASLPEIMNISTSAIQTKRDEVFIDFERRALAERIADLLKHGPTREMHRRYPLEESSGWSPACLRGVAFDSTSIRPYLYRPFDRRFIYYDDALLGRSRIAVFRNLLFSNIALATLRQTVDDAFRHVLCTRHLCDINLTISHHVSDRVFPLYLYADESQGRLDEKRTANISKTFSRRIASTLGLEWVADGRGNLTATFGPEDVFYYVYAILHSPAYRARYAEFLKIDFPRIPLAGERKPFLDLACLGGELGALHLMESPKLNDFITTYVGPKNPEVGRVGWSDGIVWLDAGKTSAREGHRATKPGTIGFRGVPEEVWDFHIGGYQVCQKWLKDRGPRKGKPGRTLTKEDISHYQKIIVALSETIRIMKEIDDVIDAHGGWPDAFASAKATT